MTIQFNPLLSFWLSLPLIAALLTAVVYGGWVLRQKQVARNWRIALTGLRTGVFCVFVLILLQPALSYTSSSPQLPEMLVLVDTSKSMSRTSAKKNRLEDALGVLQQGDFALALRERYQLRWFTFAGKVKQIDETDAASLKADGTTTQYAASIDAAYRHMRALGKTPQRVLLVSDGNDRGDDDPVTVARRHGLSVDVLLPADGKPEGLPTLEIADVQSASRVLVGSETIFRVTIVSKRPAGADRQARLGVLEDGKRILDHPLSFAAGRTEVWLNLTHRPETAGVKKYEFILNTGGAATRPYPLAVQVLDNKYEVLFLEDRWRWEYKFLHRLFEDDPSFRFTAMLSRGRGAFAQFGSPDRKIKLLGFPQSRADLEGFDTLILGDIDPVNWPRGLAGDLARLIADDGRSLVVIAGPGLAKLREIPELHILLPVELTAESGKPVEGPIRVRVRSDGSHSPFFFQFRAGEEEKLPPLDQIYPSLRKRAGATVLVEAPQQRGPYGPQIVIAEQTVGRGRVLFIATDTLWKWQTLAPTRDGPTPYSIFWQQAFRAMTPARAGGASVNLWLTPDRTRTEVGRAVALRAEVQTSRTLPPSQIEATATTPQGQRVPIVFTAEASNPRLFRASLVCAEIGLHRLAASLRVEGKSLADARVLLQAEEPRGEDDDLGVDAAALTRLAQDTGGRVIDPALSVTWPAPGASDLPPILDTHTIDPWRNFTWMFLLCALLGADWFLRVFKGLVSG
ncbi:MAG: VWA domain-containing protein [Planctomycetes bacterium]|nr:VWA domain-containing protein [Planctomycetota bacterium]